MGLMTAVGQAQPFADVCSMSGLPPKADLNASSRHVAQVPIVLQKSKIENQPTISDLCSLKCVTEVAREFIVRR